MGGLRRLAGWRNLIFLSRDFLLSEFLDSQIATRAGHVLDPAPDAIANLKRLCLDVLQPFRDSIKRPVVISSGYRDAWLNTRTGGEPDSAHLSGRAADFNVLNMEPENAVRILRLLAALPYDKVILEYNRWVHVQVAKEGKRPRRLCLEAKLVDGERLFKPYA